MNKNFEAQLILDEIHLHQDCIKSNLQVVEDRIQEAEGQEDSLSTYGRIYDKGMRQGYNYGLEKINKLEKEFIKFAKHLDINLEN